MRFAPSAMVMKGYWDNPEETARRFDPDGFHALRRPRPDRRELLCRDFTGRAKEMIIRRRLKNILTAEIGTRSGRLPQVADVAGWGARRALRRCCCATAAGTRERTWSSESCANS